LSEQPTLREGNTGGPGLEPLVFGRQRGSMSLKSPFRTCSYRLASLTATSLAPSLSPPTLGEGPRARRKGLKDVRESVLPCVWAVRV
jgi:hypothetical protein